MPVPAMMRAARMHAVGAPMSIESIPVPEPGSTDVLVEVKAASRCTRSTTARPRNGPENSPAAMASIS
jgi:D-arabinose 1-dehydrogenase-like Zn-dependent alcohol dehydrogenase